MFLLAVLLPGLNFILLFFGGLFLGRKSGIQLTILGNCISYLIIIIYLGNILNTGDIYYLSLGTFIHIDMLTVQWGFLLDTYTIVMCFVIATISLCVLFYSIEYMSKDPYKIKFYSYLNLFTFFMYIFVTSETLVQMFFG
jgi:NADH:ubiquinone oxidoreductase subunit 5 (subunit L)/multisubunit Na+/H+ antiporter MnhA subunit